MENIDFFQMNLNDKRTELHDKLNLTSAEVSYNNMAANTALGFVHSHKNNEEIYLIIKGSGDFYLDGKFIHIQEGSTLRVDPKCLRSIKAGPNGISYYCIQAKQHSLSGFTTEDCDTFLPQNVFAKKA